MVSKPLHTFKSIYLSIDPFIHPSIHQVVLIEANTWTYRSHNLGLADVQHTEHGEMFYSQLCNPA